MSLLNRLHIEIATKIIAKNPNFTLVHKLIQ